MDGRQGVDQTLKTYTHPHPDPGHVMRAYRTYILSLKRKQGAQIAADDRRRKSCHRGIIHYKAIIEEYLAAKRLVFARQRESSNV